MAKILTFLTFFFLFITPSFAFSIIRDTEIEEFLYELTEPILEAANLDIKNTKIYVVNDKSINAFVFNGQNIFIHTGLLTKYTDPNILLGVLAHEVGHIAAGHLARSIEEIKKARNIMLLSYIGGIIAAMNSNSDAGYGMIMGGNQIAQRLFLKYNRIQEEAADILALRYLKKTNDSPLGLLKLLQFFKSQMTAYSNMIDEYALSHPISQKRINLIKANLKNFPKNNKKSGNLDHKMRRIVAKLQGFLQNSDQSLKETRNKNDFFNKYKRVVALFKNKQINKSLELLQKLINKNPSDPYLFELKGQILYETGQIKNSIIAHKKSLDLKKDNPLARIIFAKAILDLNSNDIDLTKIAIKNLKITLKTESENTEIYKILSKAYNRINQEGQSNLALAKFYLLQKDGQNAKKYARKAKETLKTSEKSEILKANDIIEFAKDLDEKK